MAVYVVERLFGGKFGVMLSGEYRERSCGKNFYPKKGCNFNCFHLHCDFNSQHNGVGSTEPTVSGDTKIVKFDLFDSEDNHLLLFNNTLF